MRLYQKKIIIEYVETLHQVQKQSRCIICDNKNTNEAYTILQQCQKSAIDVGNTIESSEGKGTKAVSQIEEYCELLFQVSQLLGLSEDEVLIQKLDLLEEKLADIQHSIIDDISEEIVAVFLPYKASMWNSLESVWKAATRDSRSRTFVVPIPYYERTAEGRAKCEIYEGRLFPSYVEITDYRKFNIEDVHPERIYIHNPYDDRNFVTSVHPNFYSTVLKKYTEDLIYIPYFVLNEPDLDDDNSLQSIEHFILTPGVLNSDHTIVQSENMRQAYIKTLCRNTGVEKFEYWEKHIIGIGSPKFDSISNLRKKMLDIPVEWKRIIENECGDKKKIILYNTSVSSMLENDEKAIEKIQNVLAFFKSHNDDVALLWRPHPLLEATIQSMRPRLWAAYSGIVEKYKVENWGIYDDSPSVDRAISVCDAYYGDWSSLTKISNFAGKPVMIENFDILTEAKGEN